MRVCELSTMAYGQPLGISTESEPCGDPRTTYTGATNVTGPMVRQFLLLREDINMCNTLIFMLLQKCVLSLVSEPHPTGGGDGHWITTPLRSPLPAKSSRLYIYPSPIRWLAWQAVGDRRRVVNRSCQWRYMEPEFGLVSSWPAVSRAIE
jgi:hypothetical protein